MIPEPIRKQVGEEIHRTMMAARLTGKTKEENAWQLIRALQPFLRQISHHSLAVIHISALLKLRAAERHFAFPKKGIHIRKQMYSVGPECPFKLTTDEWTNFGKLRYWALAVHGVKDEPRSGFWRVTTRGHDFLAGQVSLPKHMFTWGPHKLYPGPELVSVRTYKQELPQFETYFDYAPPRPKRPIDRTEKLPIFSKVEPT